MKQLLAETLETTLAIPAAVFVVPTNGGFRSGTRQYLVLGSVGWVEPVADATFDLLLRLDDVLLAKDSVTTPAEAPYGVVQANIAAMVTVVPGATIVVGGGGGTPSGTMIGKFAIYEL